MANHKQRLLASDQRYGKARPTSTFLRLLLLFLVFFVVTSLIFVPRHLFPLGPSGAGEDRFYESVASCSSPAKGAICCDRSAYRTDVCFMDGDVRTHSASSSILLFSSSARTSTSAREERIRPYTRKWENGTMATIDELRLRAAADGAAVQACDVRHDVPAVVFSNGGFTGNVYHEFNDGLIPLYITSHQFNKRVVFLVVEYHEWWFSRYRDVLSRLSDFPPVDFSRDRRTHCFPQAVVGLKIHDELSINPSLMSGNETIRDFRRVLDDAYKPRVEAMLRGEEGGRRSNRPKLVLVLRKGSRKLENQRELVELAGDMGFEVEVVWPQVTLELAEIYRALSSSDVMVGVHGAAMTHFLFMRPGSVFVQIVPLGTNWAADAYYGRPARKLGLTYMRYEILPKESSLYRDYEKEHPVLADPERVAAKGWGVTKKIYLNGQNVNLDLTRFRDTLVRAYEHVVEEKQRKLLMQRMHIGGKKV